MDMGDSSGDQMAGKDAEYRREMSLKEEGKL